LKTVLKDKNSQGNRKRKCFWFPFLIPFDCAECDVPNTHVRKERLNPNPKGRKVGKKNKNVLKTFAPVS